MPSNTAAQPLTSITCPNCGKSGSLRSPLPPGAKVRCKGCNRSFEPAIEMHVLDCCEADDDRPVPSTTPPIPPPLPAAAQTPATKTFKPVQDGATEPLIPAQGQPVPTIDWAGNGAIALAAVPARVGTKECRYCGEEIRVNARKCKHCGEFLDQSAPQQANQQTVTVINQVVNDNRYPKWSPAVAALLSFFFPGLGQIYKGQLLNGLAWIFFVTLGYICFIVPGLVLHLCCVVGAASGDPTR